MMEPKQIGAQNGAGASNAQAANAKPAELQSSTAGVAFRALLERLEKSAKDLDAASLSIDHPRQLGEAVETARASVEEALLAGSDLLEAYRAAQAQAPSGATNTEAPNSTDAPTA